MKGRVFWIGAILLSVGLLTGLFYAQLSGHTDPLYEKENSLPSEFFEIPSPEMKKEPTSWVEIVPQEYLGTVNEEITITRLQESLSNNGTVRKITSVGKDVDGNPVNTSVDIVGRIKEVNITARTVVISSGVDSLEIYVGNNANIYMTPGGKLLGIEHLSFLLGEKTYLLVEKHRNQPICVIKGWVIIEE